MRKGTYLIRSGEGSVNAEHANGEDQGTKECGLLNKSASVVSKREDSDAHGRVSEVSNRGIAAAAGWR